MNRRGFIRLAGSGLFVAAAEPVRRFWQVGANIGLPIAPDDPLKVAYTKWATQPDDVLADLARTFATERGLSRESVLVFTMPEARELERRFRVGDLVEDAPPCVIGCDVELGFTLS